MNFEFGNLINQKREELGLSQEQLGARLGVTNKSVSKWETGASLPSGEVLVKLCSILGISMKDANEKLNPEKKKKIIRIVLTGGPCGGKSTALSWINNAATKKGYKVICVPEVATEVISAGFTCVACPSAYEWQKGLIQAKINKDRDYDNFVNFLNADKVLIVYDRGVMDSKAYLDGAVFKRILMEIGVRENELLSKIDAVFHLETAAKGKGYTLENNATRSEDAELAKIVDTKTQNAYLMHPHLRIIKTEDNFENKMKMLLKGVEKVLGDPICYEIERKFLIEKPDINLLMKKYAMSKQNITQAYLKTNGQEEVRIRQRGVDGDYVYTKTIKRGEGLKRIEEEKIITEQEYLELLAIADTNKKIIRKIRYSMLYKNQYIEIDVYPDATSNLLHNKAIAEVELTNENDKVELPKELVVVKDVTEDEQYKNANLASLM